MQNNNKLIGSDYLLLLLYLNNCSPINSAVKLTKMMFLFNKEISPLLRKKGANIENLPDFTPYNYGPFSKDVYEQIELFQSISFIKVKDLYKTEEMAEVDDWEESAFIDELAEDQEQYRRASDGKLMQYSLLKKGKDYVEREILPLLTKEQIQILQQFKTQITETSIKAILRYVYTKYPEMTKNSLIKDEVLGN